MKSSINLLQEAQQIQARLRKFGLVLQTASIVTLAIFGGFVFLLLSYTLILNRQQNSIGEAIDEQKQIVEGFRSAESKYLLVKQKLSLSRKAVSEPSIPYDLLIPLYELTQTQVTVGEAKSERGQTFVGLSGQAEDVFSLVQFLDSLDAFAREHQAVRVIGKGFSRSGGTGEYRFEIAFEISGEQ